jgi:hypothetical protein
MPHSVPMWASLPQTHSTCRGGYICCYKSPYSASPMLSVFVLLTDILNYFILFKYLLSHKTPGPAQCYWHLRSSHCHHVSCVCVRELKSNKGKVSSGTMFIGRLLVNDKIHATNTIQMKSADPNKDAVSFIFPHFGNIWAQTRTT